MILAFHNEPTQGTLGVVVVRGSDRVVEECSQSRPPVFHSYGHTRYRGKHAAY